MSRRWKGAAALLVASGVACDVPTGPPILEQTWVVPGEEITLSVGELLPTDVRLTPDSSAFELDVSGASFSSLLTDLCATCGILDGQVLPKPAFTDTFSTTVALPANVRSATVTGGSLVLDMFQDFGFDPLRPVASDPDVTGYMLITVTSAGVEFARDSIDGADADGDLPSGVTKTVTLPVNPMELTADLLVDVAIQSPAGDPYTVDTNADVTVDLNPSTLLLSEAEIEVPDVNVDAEVTELDLADVDSTVIERVVGGAIRVDVSNPFRVDGTLRINLSPPGAPTIQKSFTVQEGDYNQRLGFDRNELRSILGQDNVLFTANGTLATTAGAIRVTPDREMVMDTEVELTVHVGGEEQP